ncbi:hypothetical protein PCIT_b0463 [Pseudoalteromonas citrea]|uniref:NERD domain-containing protein n=2 Tax=Pseudoalteromonas citrea TaxID=43655 RepID=A0AAD4AEM6_9GAMM|nr:nuclease-related domain-containing protein [Pseudoalteromonas citrea]KAF7764458.1 hypothetical protein PCIT_b0463 [Pseudoalteromonas citrea]
MRLILYILIINVAFWSSGTLSFNPQLSINQCDRFSAEANNIKALLTVTSGVRHQQLSNRAGRLKERIDVFCQNPTEVEPQIVVALKVPVELAISGRLEHANASKVSSLSTYKNEQKQAAWQQFYRRPTHCDSYKNSMAELVRCSDEEAAQKLLFERSWTLRHPVKMLNQQNIDTTLTAANIAKAPLIPGTTQGQMEKKINLRDPNLYISSAPTQESNSAGFVPLWQYIGEYVLMIVLCIGLYITVKIVSPYGNRIIKRQFSGYYLNLILKRNLNKTQYTQYRDLVFSSAQGDVHIDQVIASQYGVFVITSQPQLDAIYADRHSETWIEKKQKKESHFANPLVDITRQKTLIQDVLGLEDNVVRLVVFNQQVQFKTPVPAEVCLIGQLVSRIDCYQSIVLDEKKLGVIHSVLLVHSSEKNTHETQTSGGSRLSSESLNEALK